MLGGPGGTFGGGGPRFGGGGINVLVCAGLEPNGVGADPKGVDAPKGAGLLKPPVGKVGVGFELTVVGRVAASIAFIFASLSSFPANIIPERIPVRNVEIGIKSSKNF